MPFNELEESTCCIYRVVDGCEEMDTAKQGNQKYPVSSTSLGDDNAMLMPETRPDILSACQIVAPPGDTYK